MKLSALVVVVFASCWVALPAQAQSPSRVVAEVEGGHEITISDLELYLDGRPDLRYGRPREDAYRRALDDLVTQQLKRVDLFESGLARDSALRRELQRSVTEELVLAYGKDQYEDRYLNEETIRAEHEAMGRVVHYQQILLNKPPGASPPVLDSLRATVYQIGLRLESGDSFETVAQHYSRRDMAVRLDEATQVTWQQSLRDPHADVLFHLSPGEVRSFEGQRSFAVARVEGIEENPVPPLGEVREKIVRALNGRHAARATRAFEREWTALVDTTALRWNTAALDQVVAWSNTPGFFEGDYHTTLRQYLAEHDDARVLTDGRGDVRLSELPRLFDEVLTLERSGRHDVELIQDFLLEAVRTERLAERARALGLDREIFAPETPSPVLAAAFVRYYNQQRIEARLPEPTEAALRDFYEAHDDSLFYQLARVNTEIIVRSDEDEIEQLWEEVQRGVPFEDVSHRRLRRTFERTRDGVIATRFSRDELPRLGEVAFGLQEGEVAGPLAYEDAEEGRLYAIVLATRRLAERQLTFEEARDRVAEEFVDHHRAQIEAEVAEELREKYGVTIYQDVLDRHLAKAGQL